MKTKPHAAALADSGATTRFPALARYAGSEVSVMGRRLVACVFGLIAAASLVSAASPIRILFMHHSTGGNLIREGEVREGLAVLGYEFWDHGYNEEGLSDSRGEPTGTRFDVPGDNTDPDGWAAVFAQPILVPPANTLGRMLEYDVILFKSCFPSSNIADEESLAGYEAYYLAIRDVVDQHPDRLFIAFTPPPLVPNETEPANAGRARRWAEYLASADYAGERRNLAVFDFFSLLAGTDGTLRSEYRIDEWDSHPNQRANETIGPLLVSFVNEAVARWRSTP
jgi:hypothetical protein